MGMRAASCVCELRPALYVPIGESTFERGYNSVIRTVHCPLQKVTYAPHDPQSTRHRLRGIPRRQPEALPVGHHVDLQT